MSGAKRSNCIRRISPKAPDEFISGLLALDGAWELIPNEGARWPMLCPEGAIHFFCVHRGRVSLQSGPVSGSFQAGEGVVFRGNGDVTLTAWTSAECALIRVRGEAAEQFCGLLDHPTCRWKNGAGAIWEAAQTVFTLSRGDQEVTAEDASMAAYRMLLALRERVPVAVAGHSTLVEGALGLLDRQFAFLSGVEEVAERLEVTREHLVRAFHKEVGMPPGKYLNMRKVEYAKQLLLETDQSVAFIAEAAGFVSANYFIRMFRKTVGVTPRAFRRQAGSEQASIGNVLDEYYVL
jgi:AraC-like DNA-binding protein